MNPRIKNKRDVSDQIIAQFGTLEEFSKVSGIDYQLLVDELVSTGFADPELITALQENGISVETT